MVLAVRQRSNEWSSQIDQRDREFPPSKWVTMGTIKAKLGKIGNIPKNIFIGQLKWAKSQTTKRTQIRNNKTLSIKQQRRLRRNGGLYFKSDKDACISSNSKILN